MRPRQPLPHLWLMTDERSGEGLWDALARLPRGAGVIFRHYATPARERRALYDRVRRIARARRLALVLAAGDARCARGWRADGVHGRSPHRAGALLRTASAHDPADLMAAYRAGADLVLLSPLFATRSHPGARVLGPVRFGLWLTARHGMGPPIIALGGMNSRRFRRLQPLGAYGWAAIDALGPDSRT